MNYHLPDVEEHHLTIQPLEQAETIPSSWYVDPRFHEFDKKEILSRHWQYVGHVSQVPNPGDYLVADVLDNPILVVRNEDGELKSFYNVCRHRGGPLATEPGHTSRLSCQYHAWSYNLNGELVSVPRFEGVEQFDKKDYCLTPVRMGVYDGIIFVDVSGEAAPLEEFYGGIQEQIQPISIASMKFVKRVLYDVQCNWKVYVDNFLEGYHIQPVHPELAKIIDVGGYATEAQENRILQSSDITEKDNPYHAEQGRAYYYYVFPNVMLNVLPTRLQLNSIIPLSEDRTITLFDYFYLETDPEKVAKTFEDDEKLSDLIQMQDVRICELVQKGLASKGYDRGRFSVQEEEGVFAFQALLKQAYRKALSRLQSS